jgi:hypothetical protein
MLWCASFSSPGEHPTTPPPQITSITNLVEISLIGEITAFVGNDFEDRAARAMALFSKFLAHIRSWLGTSAW